MIWCFTEMFSSVRTDPPGGNVQNKTKTFRMYDLSLVYLTTVVIWWWCWFCGRSADEKITLKSLLRRRLVLHTLHASFTKHDKKKNTINRRWQVGNQGSIQGKNIRVKTDNKVETPVNGWREYWRAMMPPSSKEQQLRGWDY